MNWNKYEVDGQMSIFDLDPAIWSGKTSQEHLVVTTEKISDVSSKKPRGLLTKMPLFLDLRGYDGLRAVVSWETDGLSLGEYMTRSFGESPKEEKESRLSQILEDTPHPKYYLSAKACLGILNRSEKRGKKLPEKLKKALEKQAATLSKLGGGTEVDRYGKRAGKGALIQEEKSGTLGVSQDQTLIAFKKKNTVWSIGHDIRSSRLTDDEITDPLTATDYKDPIKVAIYNQEQYDKYQENNTFATLKASGGSFGGGTESIIVQHRGRHE